MNINPINSQSNCYAQNKSLKTQSFRGLLGRVTQNCNALKSVVELREVNRYYPFPDETNDMIRAAIAHIKSLKYDEFGRGPFARGEIEIQEVLPFTKNEYINYKSKNGAVLRKGTLTQKDIEIEKYFSLASKRGLFSYKNQYKQ